MRAVLLHQAGCAQVRALHNVVQFGNVGVVEGLQDVVLSSYFLLADGH